MADWQRGSFPAVGAGPWVGGRVAVAAGGAVAAAGVALGGAGGAVGAGRGVAVGATGLGGGRVGATSSRSGGRERLACLCWHMVIAARPIYTCRRFLVAHGCMPLLATFLMVSSILVRSRVCCKRLYLSGNICYCLGGRWH